MSHVRSQKPVWRRWLFGVVLLLSACTAAHAQSNVSGNSVRLGPDGTASSSITGASQTVQISLTGYRGVGVVITGTWTGTIVPELSVDDGSNWIAAEFYKPSDKTFPTSTTANATLSIIVIGGTSHVRLRSSAWTSGTASIAIRATAAETSVDEGSFKLVDGSGNTIGATSNALDVNIKSGTPAVTQSGTWIVQPGNTPNTSAWIMQPVPGTTNGASTCVVQSAASTNATNCKNAAGLVYGIEVINTTSTIYYLRLYNLSSSPTCSSATGFIRTIPIPHGSGAGAGLANFYTVGEAYGTGIGFCLTGGGSSTDNTNAATGVYVTLFYK